MLIKWHNDNKLTNKQIEDINDIVKIKEKETNTNDDNVETVNENNTNEYWYYINMPFIDVDFSNLTSINSDTIGWVNVPSTNINYPVVQTNNNDYYLKHSFKKEYTDAGWIFMDFRNNSDFNNKNTIIYGHSRLNKTMFGTLKYTLTSNWFNNKDNRIVRISTKDYNYLYQIFSSYKIDTETYYLTVNFNDDNEYTKFLNTIKDRSIFNYNTNVNKDDIIITLSTCSENNKKTVVHAKLIKKESK